MEPSLGEFAISRRSDHQRDLERETQNVWSLGFAVAHPLLNSARLGHPADDRNDGRPEQFHKFADDLAYGQGHRGVVCCEIALDRT